MTPSQQIKEAGLKSLPQVSEISTIPIGTLKGWHRRKPKTFDFIISSCVLFIANQNDMASDNGGEHF